jgi:hypothetical protein
VTLRDISKHVATRILKTQEQLANITYNIDQVFSDALNALSPIDTPVTSDMPFMDGKCQITCVMHILTDSLSVDQDDICNMLDKSLSL